MDEHPDDAARQHDEAFSIDGQVAPRDWSSIRWENRSLERDWDIYQEMLAEDAAIEAEYAASRKPQPPRRPEFCDACGREDCTACFEDDRLHTDLYPVVRQNQTFDPGAAA